ncbi:DMT family transporter [Sporosarcina siberiensis]|uniref:DMT family transporter n=1 Tax=Sporosarcina siberiensis TaxID=1365606 RepID=A0ABW4SJS0_9BACL
MRRYIGEIGLIITAIIWGSGFVASAVALDHYTPYQILAGRFLIGVIILSIVFYKRFNKTTRSTIIKGMVLGVFLYLAFALQTVGLQYTTPSKNAFLTAINVVIVPFIGFVIYKKRLDVFELIGAVMAVTGVAVLSLKLSSEINLGDMLTLACAFAFAFHIFYTSRFVRTEDPVLITIIQMATAAIISVIVVLFKGETTFTMESEGLLPLIYLGVFSTTLAFLLQTVAQKYISETKAAIILSTEAFWGMLFSVLILSEVLTGKMAIGAILILGAIIVSETKFSFLGGKKLYIEKK